MIKIKDGKVEEKGTIENITAELVLAGLALGGLIDRQIIPCEAEDYKRTVIITVFDTLCNAWDISRKGLLKEIKELINEESEQDKKRKEQMRNLYSAYLGRSKND